MSIILFLQCNLLYFDGAMFLASITKNTNSALSAEAGVQ